MRLRISRLMLVLLTELCGVEQELYPTVTRLIPSDALQGTRTARIVPCLHSPAQNRPSIVLLRFCAGTALARLIASFGWTQCAMIVQTDTYGRSLVRSCLLP